MLNANGIANSKILIVDDEEETVKLLEEILRRGGYTNIRSATDPMRAIPIFSEWQPDLLLLDLVMPHLDGFAVLRQLHEVIPPMTYFPILVLSATSGPGSRQKALSEGAKDFLPKPVDVSEVHLRVRNLLEARALHLQLQNLNKKLELLTQKQATRISRLSQLKRFVPSQLAEQILAGVTEDPLKTHRREISVVFSDLRGFTQFAETSEPEEVMEVLAEYHREVARLVEKYKGTIGNFSGDSIMVMFNDPIAVADHEQQAVLFAIEVRDALYALHEQWLKRCYDLGVGVGIASGYATLGVIGAGDLREYTVIGTVANLAARLCDEARSFEVLIPQRLWGKVDDIVETELGDILALKGLHRPVQTFKILKLRERCADVVVG